MGYFRKLAWFLRQILPAIWLCVPSETTRPSGSGLEKGDDEHEKQTPGRRHYGAGCLTRVFSRRPGTQRCHRRRIYSHHAKHADGPSEETWHRSIRQQIGLPRGLRAGLILRLGGARDTGGIPYSQGPRHGFSFARTDATVLSTKPKSME